MYSNKRINIKKSASSVFLINNNSFLLFILYKYNFNIVKILMKIILLLKCT